MKKTFRKKKIEKTNFPQIFLVKDNSKSFEKKTNNRGKNPFLNKFYKVLEKKLRQKLKVQINSIWVKKHSTRFTIQMQRSLFKKQKKMRIIICRKTFLKEKYHYFFKLMNYIPVYMKTFR